ncbi:putative antirepressor [Betaentomopoxvirus amoorei]|uniref:AMV175 n=1 Tax=Amsacta moorei entomopoxvirus TaxID=28321 RepID=Q9EMM4_AMEPV|nr:putative antirepressor [Amsacta moorei entomopoxvirus]AAG02881.1 AMV175 [Amsacta moorei entomopoxvirus]
MENILIKDSTYSDLNYNLNDEIDIKFIETFNEIFNYNDVKIKVIGTINNPWFCGKNILKALEYSDDSHNKILNRLDDKFKDNMYNILSSVRDNLSMTKNNKNKAIYLNEPGIYYIILHCTKDSAKGFQDFILFDLLPTIRKRTQKKYIDIINNKQDKIDILSIKLDNISKQNNELLTQNQLALNKLQELGINLIETKEEIKDVKDKLNVVIEDRNVKPKEVKLQHKYLLLKNKIINNEYKFIRAQDQYIKTNKSNWLEKHNVIIDEKYNPNPIDMCSRLKSKIYELDKIRINNLKDRIKDKSILKDRLGNRKPFIEINGNKFTLNRCEEYKFINIIKSIENEQYDI